METATVKQKGNPNWGAKKKEAGYDPTRRYRFQLIQSYESAKGRDSKTGELAQNPYPPIYMIPNSGVAFNKKTGEVERWRYVYGYNSIWVHEQMKPEPTKDQLNNERNDLIFREGFLMIEKNQEARFEALMIQDICENNENPLEQKPKVFRVIDPYKDLMKVRSDADEAFEAEKAAREATREEMLPLAMLFGINVDNPNEREEEIRTAFILRAKSSPSTFNREFVNPKNSMKYAVTTAMQRGELTVVEGQLVFAETGRLIMSVKPDGDIPDQIATLAFMGDEIASKLVDQLSRKI